MGLCRSRTAFVTAAVPDSHAYALSDRHDDPIKDSAMWHMAMHCQLCHVFASAATFSAAFDTVLAPGIRMYAKLRLHLALRRAHSLPGLLASYAHLRRRSARS